MKLFKKLLSCILALSMSVSMALPLTVPASAEDGDDILLTYTLGPGRYGAGTDAIGEEDGGITDNADGTRTCTEKRDIYNSAKFVLPKGMYYFKTLVKVSNPTGDGAIARVKFENGVNDTYHDALYAADVPDENTWIPVTIPLEVDELEDGKRQQIKLIHGSTSGDADSITAARQFFVSTDPTPLSVPETPDVVASFILENDRYGTSVRYIANPDGSRTSTINRYVAHSMKATPGIGQYYLKLNVKLEGIKPEKLDSRAGYAEVGDGNTIDMPAAGEFVEGEWKSIVLPVVVPDGEQEILISGNVGAADRYTIGKFIELSTNDTPMPVKTYDVTEMRINAEQIENGFADIGHRNGEFIPASGDEPAAYKFNAADNYDDYFAFRMLQRYTDELTPGPGMIPMTTLYLNVKAKVSKLPSTAEEENLKLFGADMITASVGSVEQGIRWGDFDKVNEYEWVTMKMDLNIESFFLIDNPDMEFRLAIRKPDKADTDFYFTEYVISDVNLQEQEEAAERQEQEQSDMQKASDVIDAINSLPEVITADQSAAVAEIRASYEALSQQAKAYVTKEAYEKLSNAESVLEYIDYINDNQDPDDGKDPEPDQPVVTSVALSRASLSLIVNGTASEKSGVLTASVNGTGLTEADKRVSWISTNPSVAKVVNGTVTAAAKGYAVIIASVPSGKFAYASVNVTERAASPAKNTVKKKAVTKVRFKKKTYTLKVNKKLSLDKIIKSTVPKAANALKPKYKLSVAARSKKYVRISGKTIKALKKGRKKTVTVTVRNNGRKVGTFKIKIR